MPHGLYIHHEDSTLYVINHAMLKGGERIEVFKIQVDDNNTPIEL